MARRCSFSHLTKGCCSALLQFDTRNNMRAACICNARCAALAHHLNHEIYLPLFVSPLSSAAAAAARWMMGPLFIACMREQENKKANSAAFAQSGIHLIWHALIRALNLGKNCKR
jgi:hypothetical protein